MSLVDVDKSSNPFGQRAAARCRRCGLAIGGLVLVDGDFEHRDEATCAEAERIMQELDEELVS